MRTRPTTRRASVAGAVSLPAVAPGLPALAEGETPILRLFRQWEALIEETESAYQAVKGQGMDAEDAVYKAYAPERHRIEEALIAEPATDLRGLGGKVLAARGEARICP